MKNIKNTLLTLLMIICLASSLTNAFQHVTSTQSQSVCEEISNSDFEIMLCHDNNNGGANG